MTIRRLYMHGSGRRGADAWPHARDLDAHSFVSFPPESSVAQQVEKLVAYCGDDRMLIFAHSIGAEPVVRAASRLNLAGLVLVEPALHDIARGDPSIERHIGIVTEARSQAETGDLRAFWAMLRPLMFGGPFDATLWDAEETVARRWATTNLPWGHGVRAGMIDEVRTLVVTSGWNDEYERIAGALASDTTTHVVLPGFDHRPQDSPDFRELVAAFAKELAVPNY